MGIFVRLNEKYLLMPKMLYFTLAMLFYTFHQFRSEFIKTNFNVSNRSIGAAIGYIQMISFIGNIWIARFNDRTGRQRFLLTGLIAASAVFFQLFFAVPNTSLFWVVFCIYFCLLSAAFPLLDKVMLDYLANTPGTSPESYGMQRLFASFGYLFTNFTIEHLCKSSSGKTNFGNMAYYNAIAAVLVGILTISFVRNLPSRATSQNYLSSMLLLMRNGEFMYLMLVVLLCGVVRASMTTYLGVYYKEVLQFKNSPSKLAVPWPASSVIDFFYRHKQSTTTLFGVSLEIIIFFNSARLINSLGLFLPLFLAQIAQLIRFVGYYLLDYQNPNAFLISCGFELLKGLTFGLIQCSAAILVSKMAPPSLKTTGQIIYTGTFIALGTVLSGLIFMPVFSPNSKLPPEEAHGEFMNVFLINIIICIGILALFIYKYALRENLLFNRENAEAKLRGIEENARVETEMDKKEQIKV